MRFIAILITICNLNLMAQNTTEDWRGFYLDKLVSIPEMQIQEIDNTSEILYQTNKFNYIQKTYRDLIENNSYKTFLGDFQATKELSNIGLVMPFDTIEIVISNLINHCKPNTNLAFTQDYNVFLKLIERFQDKETEIIQLLEQYLRKAVDLYALEWLNHYSLYCEFVNPEESEELLEYWLSKSETNNAQFYFEINKIRLLRLRLSDVKLEYENVINSSLNETHKIYLMYVLSSNKYLTDNDRKTFLGKLKAYEPITSIESDLCVLHSSIKNLDSAYSLPSGLMYVQPIDWTIEHLKSKGIIKPLNTTAYFIHSKFYANYNLQTEKILSWIFNYNGGQSAYYSYPEPYNLNDELLSEVFFNYFNSNDKFTYSLENNEKYLIIEVICSEDKLTFKIEKQDSYQISLSIAFVTNLILEHLNSDKRLIHFKFEYPLYFIQNRDNIRFLINEYNLKIEE